MHIVYAVSTNAATHLAMRKWGQCSYLARLVRGLPTFLAGLFVTSEKSSLSDGAPGVAPVAVLAPQPISSFVATSAFAVSVITPLRMQSEWSDDHSNGVMIIRMPEWSDDHSNGVREFRFYFVDYCKFPISSFL
jgi:hypothetical protein